MATYKVIQDVEAEDKLLGPLTLRQFIYAGITSNDYRHKRFELVLYKVRKLPCEETKPTVYSGRD